MNFNMICSWMRNELRVIEEVAWLWRANVPLLKADNQTSKQNLRVSIFGQKSRKADKKDFEKPFAKMEMFLKASLCTHTFLGAVFGR